GGCGFGPGGAADVLQALGVDEAGQYHLALQQALAVGVSGVDAAILLDAPAGLLARRVAGGPVAGNAEFGAVLAGAGVVELDLQVSDTAAQLSIEGNRAYRRYQFTGATKADRFHMRHRKRR